MVIIEEFVDAILKLFARGIFYVDLLCPLISGRCNGRELTTATPQLVMESLMESSL